MAVGKEIVGASVTCPTGAGDGPGEAVHVGGMACGMNGKAGPRGLSATARKVVYPYTPMAVISAKTMMDKIVMMILCNLVMIYLKKYGISAGAGSKKYTVTQPESPPMLLSSYPRSIHCVRATPKAVSTMGPPPVSPMVATP